MNDFVSKLEAVDWLSKSKYGLFVHFLYPRKRTRFSINGINEMVNMFDTEFFAENCEKAGVEYVMFTLGQNSGYYCAPNRTYDDICGFRAGEKCSYRDLPMDLAFSLRKRGIKLFLYAPSNAPSKGGDEIQVKFGAKSNDILWNDYKVNSTVRENWCAVLKEWASRYGENIVGWWFDGNFPDVGIDNDFAVAMEKAVSSGNPHILTAYNPGQQKIVRHRPVGAYTAGEMRDLKWAPDDKYVDGLLWHILTYMGTGWGEPSARYTDEYVTDFIKRTSEVGAAVTFDIFCDCDGSFSEQQMQQFMNMKKMLR